MTEEIEKQPEEAITESAEEKASEEWEEVDVHEVIGVPPKSMMDELSQEKIKDDDDVPANTIRYKWGTDIHLGCTDLEMRTKFVSVGGLPNEYHDCTVTLSSDICYIIMDFDTKDFFTNGVAHVQKFMRRDDAYRLMLMLYQALKHQTDQEKIWKDCGEMYPGVKDNKRDFEKTTWTALKKINLKRIEELMESMDRKHGSKIKDVLKEAKE